MSSASVRRSSSSEADSQPGIDERKRKRMLSNRESARRSRMRKQQHLDDLLTQQAQLKNQNNQIAAQIDAVMQQYVEVDSNNAILRAQANELTARLHSMNSVLRRVAEVSGIHMDIPEIPDPLLKPWQVPCSTQPIMASADMLRF